MTGVNRALCLFGAPIQSQEEFVLTKSTSFNFGDCSFSHKEVIYTSGSHKDTYPHLSSAPRCTQGQLFYFYKYTFPSKELNPNPKSQNFFGVS